LPPWAAATVAGTLRCAVRHSSRHTPLCRSHRLCRSQGFALQQIKSSERHMECAYHLGQPLDEPTGAVYGQVH
ncbi:MAG: hypothetical protein KGS49_04500, partial [Planctomycetes bacterium]|nr:hypothetical protein [Planctomycetota bacterium]